MIYNKNPRGVSYFKFLPLSAKHLKTSCGIYFVHFPRDLNEKQAIIFD